MPSTPDVSNHWPKHSANPTAASRVERTDAITLRAVLHIVSGVVGVGLVLITLADLTNVLISTSTSTKRWWPSMIIGRSLFALTRRIALRRPEGSPFRETVLTVFGPVMLIVLLLAWGLMQILGFGLLWWAIEDTPGVTSISDAIYYSGVVFFTVGFGEIVPVSLIPRIGVLIEALFGVGTVALVVGYLPSLYSAYSERERQLMTLDDGQTDRITPTDLVLAWAPDANTARLDAQFEKWEQWAAGILETQSALPLLMFFRSHDYRQNWVTGLGLLSDAAMHAQIIKGAADGPSFWFLRRAEAIFVQMTNGADLSKYEVDGAAEMSERGLVLFDEFYSRLEDHGFELYDKETALTYIMEVRQHWAPRMEFLIDFLVAPRGFWPISSQIPRVVDVASAP